eukprot:2684158-Pyramimonas_sp.AAC.1
MFTALNANVDGLRSEMTLFSNTVRDHGERIGKVEGRQDDTETRTADLEAAVTTLQMEQTALQAEIEGMKKVR